VPVFTAPQFGWSALVSLALPLFVVTMASQNLPGVAAIQAAGYGGAQGMSNLEAHHADRASPRCCWRPSAPMR
jgi:predicted benzoate:H+ symporter BenE